MTEAEWLSARNPSRLLDLIREMRSRLPVRRLRLPVRRLRLYIHACCRLLPSEVVSEPLAEAMRVCDEYVDGQLTLDELNQFRGARVPTMHRFSVGWLVQDTLFDVVLCANSRLWDSATRVGNVVSDMLRSTTNFGRMAVSSPQAFHTVREQQCHLLRDIFENLTRPAQFASEWRTSTVMALARGIYEERAFDRLPLLMDALMDAGCADEEVLGHCRQTTGHHRGCWLVDMVLEKE